MPLKKAGLVRFRQGVKAAIDRGVGTAAGYVADVATQLAPVDTGALQGSIRVEGTEGSLKRTVHAGGGAVDYAAYVEYGTDKSPAQPFMTPAADAIDVSVEVEKELKALL